MRGLIRLSVIVPLVVAGFGAGVLALWPIGAPEPAAFPPGDAERGAYLARASGCVSCHTNAAAKGLALAGGAPLDTPFGTFVPPNITPHTTAGSVPGPSRISPRLFDRASRRRATPTIRSSHIRSTQASRIRRSPTCGKRSAPFRRLRMLPRRMMSVSVQLSLGLKLWRAAYLDAPETDALMGTSSPWNRGRLLVEGAAHCAACHTGRTLAGGLDASARFAGNDSLPGGSKAPSILTADLLEGGWTVANLAYALQSGLLPNGDAFGGSMAEVVAEGTSYLTDADREAIATYLLDPDGSGDIPEPAPPAGDPDGGNGPLANGDGQ